MSDLAISALSNLDLISFLKAIPDPCMRCGVRIPGSSPRCRSSQLPAGPHPRGHHLPQPRVMRSWVEQLLPKQPLQQVVQVPDPGGGVEQGQLTVALEQVAAQALQFGRLAA